MSKVKKQFWSLLSLPIAQAAVSDTGWDTGSLGEKTNLSGISFQEVLLTFINWSLIVVGLMGVVVFIYAGYTYLTAGGKAKNINQAKKVVVYGIVGLVVSIAGVAILRTVDTIMNAGQKSETVNQVSLVEKPISEIVKNSNNIGQLSAALPKNTSIEEIEKALENLPEGNSLSFTSSGKGETITVLTFKKENNQIKLLYVNKEKIKGSSNPNTNKGSFLNNVFKVAKADTTDTSSISGLSKNQLISLLTQLITLLQSDDNVITIVTDPPINDLPNVVTFGDTLSKCITTGGSWFRFSNLCVAEKNKCSTTTDVSNCSVLGLTPSDGCQCPASQCADALGQCVAKSDPNSDNPCFNQTICTTYGGFWDNSNQPNIECRCLSIAPTPVPEPQNPYKQVCVNSGGTWDDSNLHFRPRFFPHQGGGSCSCSCGGCSCFDANGAKIQDQSQVDSLSQSSGATAEMALDCGNSSTLTDSEMQPNSTNSWGNPWRKPWRRQPACHCPVGKVVDQSGSCVSVTITNDPEINNCTNSGGSWTLLSGCCGKEMQKCGSENLVCSCTPNYPSTSGCQCPEGTCVGNNGQCISDGTIPNGQISCENSGGTWDKSSAAYTVNVNRCYCPTGMRFHLESGECVGNDMVVKKPAVYLYPEKTMKINVSVKVNGSIIKSDPEYGSGWLVSAEPSGLINNKLDYLFYEASLEKINLPNEGWVVKYEDLQSWFNEKLPQLGLNEKEKSQFEEYWLKELSKANFYEIKLLSDEFLKENMDLKISPKPDTVIRRNFYFKPLGERIETQEPEIVTPERKGFTVVEWGGMNE